MTNPGSSILSKFVGYVSIDADDEAEGWKHPTSYINQSKKMDYYTTLEASRTPGIELDMQRMVDILADIKLKLTCTNSIAAMTIIYMEQMKYHRATEQRAIDGWISR